MVTSESWICSKCRVRASLEDWGAGSVGRVQGPLPGTPVPVSLGAGGRPGKAWIAGPRWPFSRRWGEKEKAESTSFSNQNEGQIRKYRRLDFVNNYNVTNWAFPVGPAAGEHQWLQHELPEALPGRPPHQASASGLHHPHSALDLRAVLQGKGHQALPPEGRGSPVVADRQHSPATRAVTQYPHFREAEARRWALVRSIG